jgi:hypothetical protein
MTRKDFINAVTEYMKQHTTWPLKAVVHPSHRDEMMFFEMWGRDGKLHRVHLNYYLGDTKEKLCGVPIEWDEKIRPGTPTFVDNIGSSFFCP